MRTGFFNSFLKCDVLTFRASADKAFEDVDGIGKLE